jgi:putative transferase (TIGR04331 family)
MKTIQRYLVTTADERTWKFDRPVLFLGEWCRLYDRKHIWQGMDAVVAEPYGLKPGQLKRDIAYIQALSRQLLPELAQALNAFHGTVHSVRYWEILLGHWLQRYVALTFNRYFALEQALNQYEVCGTTVFDCADYSLATTDTVTFIWASSDNVWNHVLYSKILNFLGGIQTARSPAPLIEGGYFSLPKVDQQFPEGISAKQFIRSVANIVLPKFAHSRDALIVNSFLPVRVSIKLQLALWQCPQTWRSPSVNAVPPCKEVRQEFGIDATKHTGYEQFIRSLLHEVIPSCFVEGYGQLNSQVHALPWPALPKFIFTSNNFDTDEVFKAWAGLRVEEGVTYLAGQHGNNYGTHVYLGNTHWPESVAADKFITWGWTHEDPKFLPGFIFSIAGLKPSRLAENGKLLLIELHPPHRLGPEDSYFNFGIYQQEQFDFANRLPETIRQQMTVRLHSSHRSFRWQTEQRWKDSSPDSKIEATAISIQDSIAQSRLVVYSYDSTGILETLAQNIPTLCFWYGGLEHLQESAKPYYEQLCQAGILQDSPESAARKVAEVWNDVRAWWFSEEVQSVRKIFCDRYARVSNDPVSELKQILKASALNS